MKLRIITAVVAGLLLGGVSTTVWAQASPGPGRGGNGRGYGGPPSTEQERAARQAECQERNGGVCPGGRYGGPPRNEQERAARQAACLERNGGVCPNGGPRANCPIDGQGRFGNGQRKQAGKNDARGLRDGTGPRAARRVAR